MPNPFLVLEAFKVGSDIAQTISGISGGKKAAKAQAQATREAIAEQRRAREEFKKLTQPYRGVGESSLYGIQNILRGLSPNLVPQYRPPAPEPTRALPPIPTGGAGGGGYGVGVIDGRQTQVPIPGVRLGDPIGIGGSGRGIFGSQGFRSPITGEPIRIPSHRDVAIARESGLLPEEFANLDPLEIRRQLIARGVSPSDLYTGGFLQSMSPPPPVQTNAEALPEGLEQLIARGRGLASGGLQSFQYGGIVNEPTLAMIGEAGPEAVVPLRRPNLTSPPPPGYGGGGGVTISGGYYKKPGFQEPPLGLEGYPQLPQLGELPSPFAAPTDQPLTASPYYQFQRGQGEEAINRQLAARGLYNSGAGLRELSDFYTRLGAEESQRQFGQRRQLTGEQLGIYETNLTRAQAENQRRGQQFQFNLLPFQERQRILEYLTNLGYGATMGYGQTI